MTDYLPDAYVGFRASYPSVASALDELARATEEAGLLDPRVLRLVKLALAVGSLSPGATRSNTRKALDAGDSPEEIRQVAVLAITTCGFPTAIAALGWIEEVLAAPTA